MTEANITPIAPMTRVRAGQPGTEDYDEGVVLAVTQHGPPQALVAWDSEVRTWTPLDLLEVIQ